MKLVTKALLAAATLVACAAPVAEEAGSQADQIGTSEGIGATFADPILLTVRENGRPDVARTITTGAPSSRS